MSSNENRIIILLILWTNYLSIKCPQCESEFAPFYARLEYENRLFCGGVLIGNHWMLTSADCAEDKNPKNFEVIINLFSYFLSAGISEFIIHPNYKSGIIKNNLAIANLILDYKYPDDYKFLKIKPLSAKCPVYELITSVYGMEKDKLCIEEIDVDLECDKVTSNTSNMKQCEEKFTMFHGDFLLSRDCNLVPGGPVLCKMELVGILIKPCEFRMQYEQFLQISPYLEWILLNSELTYKDFSNINNGAAKSLSSLLLYFIGKINFILINMLIY